MLSKILRHNIRPAQLIGFMLANLLGGFIVLVGIQAYVDFDQLMEADDGLFRGDQIVITKPVSALNSLGSMIGLKQGFSDREVHDLSQLPGVRSLGAFTSAQCKVRGIIAFGALAMQTDMFLEAVPDEFVDVSVTDDEHFAGWTAKIDDTCIPIILPRNYLNLYNYGYATTRGLPQLSEGLASSFPLALQLTGGGDHRTYEARIVGFSTRINTILAPADFIAAVNQHFVDEPETLLPTRLVVATQSQEGGQELLTYLDQEGYVIEGNSDTVKIQSFVHGVLYILGGVGLAITLLAFYLLAICISLLTERNRDRLSALYSIGYPIRAIATPYRLLVICLDVVVWLAASLLAAYAYGHIAAFLKVLQPHFQTVAFPVLCVAAVAFTLIAVLLHCYIIHQNIRKKTIL